MTDAEIEARAYQTTLDEAKQTVRATLTLGIPHPQQLGQQLDLVADVCGLNHLPPPGKDAPRRQLIDTWSAHQADKAHIAALEWELSNLRTTVGAKDQRLERSSYLGVFNCNEALTAELVHERQRIAALERELAAMTKEMAYANQRMTVAIQTSNQLLDAEVARRKAAAIVVPQPVARTFPDLSRIQPRRDGWIMVR
jgi:hypothetical protein